MSLYSVADTGKVPPPPSGENEFQNVNVGLENNSNNSANDNNAATANATATATNAPESAIGEGETVATEESIDVATAEPVSATAISKSGKPLSAAQANVQRLRAETLTDMRKKYAERFADTTMYPKPPKAKAYHASGLTTIRQRDGEAAYEAALKDIMDKNDPTMGANGMSQRAMTQKSKKKQSTNLATLRNNSAVVRNNSANLNSPLRNNSTNARNSVLNATSSSIEEMGRSAKSLIDSIVKTAKMISRAPNAKPLAPLLNASKSFKPKRVRSRPTKKAAPLFTVPEETSANVFNSANATA